MTKYDREYLKMDKQTALMTIEAVKRLLSRYRSALQGGNGKFTDIEIEDIAEILGFLPDEITELISED